MGCNIYLKPHPLSVFDDLVASFMVGRFLWSGGQWTIPVLKVSIETSSDGGTVALSSGAPSAMGGSICPTIGRDYT